MKKQVVWIFLMLCCLPSLGCRPFDLRTLREWRAGETISADAVQTYGLDSCFVAIPIPDKIWACMQGKTYQENPYIQRQDLRYLRVLHWNVDEKIHLGEMVCNQLIADKLINIFRQLYEAHYPIQRMLLPDVYDADDETQMRANNTSCFCYRVIVGSSRLSKHALGLAIDINTLYNPYVKKRKDGSLYVQPATAVKYCDRNGKYPYKITHQDLCYRLFLKYGFSWGGDWKSYKDYQHFEYKP